MKPKSSTTRTDAPAAPLAAPVVPRLLHRREAAAYLAMSPSQFDLQRQLGKLTPIFFPSERNPNGRSRVPVWDRCDLDSDVDAVKAEQQEEMR